MAHVSVSVNGRTYKMGCREGEETRILELAAEIEAHVQRFKGSLKSVPDDRLFLMAAIVIADQLWDARDELQWALKQVADFQSYQVIEGGRHAAPREVARAAEGPTAKLEALAALTSRAARAGA